MWLMRQWHGKTKSSCRLSKYVGPWVRPWYSRKCSAPWCSHVRRMHFWKQTRAGHTLTTSVKAFSVCGAVCGVLVLCHDTTEVHHDADWQSVMLEPSLFLWKRALLFPVLLLEESSCPQGSSRINLHFLVTVLVLDLQVLPYPWNLIIGPQNSTSCYVSLPDDVFGDWNAHEVAK